MRRTTMSVIRLPKKPKPGPLGPQPIYVCAPTFEAMAWVRKKFGLGFSRQEAKVAFYGGDPDSQTVETRVVTLNTASGKLKHHTVNQLELFNALGQELSAVETEARERLGSNPYLYSAKGPSAPRRKGGSSHTKRSRWWREKFPPVALSHDHVASLWFRAFWTTPGVAPHTRPPSPREMKSSAITT
jgi:hypothetical protein